MNPHHNHYDGKVDHNVLGKRHDLVGCIQGKQGLAKQLI